ncbi:MAG: hypothetical protein ACRCUX_00465, partial [Beijerinckiaceae bacterium]
MAIRGRVGKHLSTGKQCQNWKADQQTIIALLNKISVADGGAGGALAGKTVPGIASRGLCAAIVTFEKKQFSNNARGFVEPGGAVLARMQALATAPKPPPPGPTAGMRTASVITPLDAALADDGAISHAEGVHILRSILSDGIIAQSELDDIRDMLANITGIAPQTRAMFTELQNMILLAPANKGPFTLATDAQKKAADKVCDFMTRSGSKYFRKLNRFQIGIGLLMRIAHPGMMDQDMASVCGPAVLLFNVAKDDPEAYVSFAIDLYEKGAAFIWTFGVIP